MSWWPVPDSQSDLIGDAPADAVDGALARLLEARAQAGAPPPTLGEVARALGDALRAARALFADGATVRRVYVPGVEPAAAAPLDLQGALAQALGELCAAYRRALERPPRVREALYTFTFCFGGRPETLVSGPRPARIVFECERV
jgi:hypothetical protein